MIETAVKQQIIDGLKAKEKSSGMSAARFARTLGINPAQWSRLKKGELDGVLADSKFITLARENDIVIGNSVEWHTAKTATFQYIYSLLSICQEQGIATLLVDKADIGKTHTCKYYARNNRNVVYIDCSQVKSKQLFVREIARQFGVSHTGRYADVYRDLVFYINTLSNALIILDEAGDLKYDAFLENKSLWNATEGNVGWFMTGADGLKEKIRRAIDNKKVGYTEIFRRYGSDYRKVSPDGKEALNDFLRNQVAQVIQANAPKSDIQKLTKSSRNSLTNAYNLIRVMNRK